MKFNSNDNTRQMMTGMVIVLLMSTFFTLAPCVHLEICFGLDGHIDTTPGTCLTDSTGQPQQHAWDKNEHSHHENCLDVVIGCTSLDTLIHTVGKGRSLKTDTIRNDPSSVAGYTISAFSRQPGQHSMNSFLLHNAGGPSPSPLARQTVVLLI